MKLAAGVVIAAVVLFGLRITMLTAGAQTASQQINRTAERIQEQNRKALERAQAARREQLAEIERKKAADAEAAAAARRASCYVIAADGRRITCPPGSS
ncbi:MAG: hypothetical protein AB7P31_06275 [Steroidobacteraceae bacterium]